MTWQQYTDSQYHCGFVITSLWLPLVLVWCRVDIDLISFITGCNLKSLLVATVMVIVKESTACSYHNGHCDRARYWFSHGVNSWVNTALDVLYLMCRLVDEHAWSTEIIIEWPTCSISTKVWLSATFAMSGWWTKCMLWLLDGLWLHQLLTPMGRGGQTLLRPR